MEFTITNAEGKNLNLEFKKPDYNDFDEAEKAYSTKIASLVRQSGKNKLLLRVELDTYLKSIGVWTKEDETNVTNLQKEIENRIKKLSRGGMKLKSEARELAISIMDLRKEIVKIMQKRQIFDDSTIESMAEAEKTDYLIYSCVLFPDTHNRYWESFEDMKNDKTSEAYRKASVLAMKLIYGVDPEFEKNLPEIKWLQKYKFVDEHLDYIDRNTGQKVDRSGNPVKSIEEDINSQLQTIAGNIDEEEPFIDDETGEKVVLTNEDIPKESKRKKK